MKPNLSQLQAAPDLVDQVYRALLDAISTGTLAPGERLTQEDIAERLGVSRQPVLQALRQLKKDGFVTDAKGRGVLVSALDPQWMLKMYQVRGALDALAARLAARQHAVIDAGLIAQGRQAAAGKDVQAMIESDLAFHQAIYQASNNPIIAQTAGQHWQHLRRAMGAVLQQSGQRDTVWDEHAAIAQAIAAGDGQRAADLIEGHAQRAGSTMLQQLILAQAG
jgi:DNA-binding GntR family transcriptional regulator